MADTPDIPHQFLVNLSGFHNIWWIQGVLLPNRMKAVNNISRILAARVHCTTGGYIFTGVCLSTGEKGVNTPSLAIGSVPSLVPGPIRHPDRTGGIPQTGYGAGGPPRAVMQEDFLLIYDNVFMSADSLILTQFPNTRTMIMFFWMDSKEVIRNSELYPVE